MNLRLEFLIQVANGLIILAIGEKKENTDFLKKENKSKKEQYKGYSPRKSTLNQTYFFPLK